MEKEKGKKKAVFFDRDGVILKVVIKKGFPRPPQSIAEYKAQSGIIPGAKEAVAQIRKLGFLAILVTNQPDIAYGNISREDWQWIQDQLKDIHFDDAFFCFHGRDEGCECKKPKPGLLLEAARKWNINLAQSFMVGDTERDTFAGRAAHCKTILLDSGYNKGVATDARIIHLSQLPPLLQ